MKYSRDQSTRVAQAAHLLGDGVAGFLLPFPHLAMNFSRPRSWRDGLLRCQLAFHHDLRGDAGVVGARHPQRVVAAHAVIAGQASMIVWLNAWPMCSVPVTLGGGS